MKVQEVMSRNPHVCRDDEKLVAAVRIMWESDCGCVPIVDAQDTLTGIVTDRDACMAGYTRGQRFDEITVRSAMALRPVTCRPDDPLEVAEAAMLQNQVRRLPVVDGKGRVVGILSSNDLVRAAVGNHGLSASVVTTLAGISAPRRLETTKAAVTTQTLTTQARSAQAADAIVLPSLMQAPKTAPAAPAAPVTAGAPSAAQPGAAPAGTARNGGKQKSRKK